MTPYIERRRACAWCETPFIQRRPMQKVCGPKCAVSYTNARREKVEAKAARKAKQEGRLRLMTRSDWMRKAQASFNAYIRARDAHLPCIACGKMSTASIRYSEGQRHASHYRSVGAAPELRFNEDNVHAACSPCNVQLSGNIVEYRKGLLRKIGAERLAWLEGPHPPIKLSIPDIQALEQKYRELARELEGQQRQAA